MKRVFAVIIAGALFSACAGKKADKDAALNEVIKIHDKVMGADEQLMKNKMLLDTLLKQDKIAAKDSAKKLLARLNAADSDMENWMHKFDPDQTGKSNDDAAAYFTSQKKLIMAIDSQLNAAVSQSNQYLKNIKTK